MNMTTGLQLRTGTQLSQQLKMTPALQQAIRLLQLSNLELQQEVQQALESNMMLESDDSSAESLSQDAEYDSEDENNNSTEDRDATDFDDQLPEDLVLDHSWDDVYDRPNKSNTPTEEGQSAVERIGALRDLQGHLRWQLRLEGLPLGKHGIAEALIDSIDDDGYLQADIEDLSASLHADIELVEEVLQHIQQRFEPAGIAARTLSECLLLQLAEHPQDASVTQLASLLAERHLDDLPGSEPAKLARKLGVREELLAAAIELIRELDPKPGSAFGGERTEYIVPEVYVWRDAHGTWRVRLSRDSLPRIRVNNEYAQIARNMGSSKDGEMLRNHLTEARWLIRAIHSRNDTLLRVAEQIVSVQRDFFEHGPEHIKPLVLREIAEAVELHESTISRVTSNKYLHSPRGLLPFKYFFSSHVGTVDGGEAAATAIQAMLKKLIDGESARKPLSDAKLVSELQAKNIEIARRTVAKYREQMGIPPSHERKRLM